MNERIVVATDLSEPADEAVRQAHARAQAPGARLTVVHVIPNLVPSDPLFPQLEQQMVLALPALQARITGEVSRRVEGLTGRETGGFEVVVEVGVPHAVIVQRAEQRRADLVVVGSQGSSGVARTLLGSVADKVVRHAHCPVLVARHTPKSARVLVATDFSDPSLPAVAAAGEEARRTGARVTILNSIDLGPALPESASMSFGAPSFGFSPEVREDLRKTVDAMLANALSHNHIDGDRQVAYGPAAAAILRAAEQLPAELVVVGTIGRTGLPRLLLGSVAEAVVRSAPCAVLVVRLSAP
jgi:nucleotide-binding universal stress UspA family protein